MEKLEIHTKRLVIRNLKIADLDNFYLYRSNPEVCKYQGFDVLTKAEARAFIFKQNKKLFFKPNQWVQYGIELKETGALIGDCAIKISSLENGTASIGITITPNEQKKGLANEALKAIIDLLFRYKKVHRIVENLSADNKASRKLLKRHGFRKEGLFLEEHMINGKWSDLLQFALLKKEWDTLK
ncbi:MAG: GNAT family protein [Flavobacteriaceae bacterium]